MVFEKRDVETDEKSKPMYLIRSPQNTLNDNHLYVDSNALSSDDTDKSKLSKKLDNYQSVYTKQYYGTLAVVL